jgi:peptidoglycan/LPS O-acetylase OafA/YrhL
LYWSNVKIFDNCSEVGRCSEEELWRRIAGNARVNFSEYQNRRYVPALDALRAISVFLVITVHVHLGNFKWLAGAQGVTIFFVISGYLITFLSLREERERQSLNLAAFYIRRTFRIFPVYYLTVAVYVFLILIIKVKPDKIENFRAELPYLLTYLQEIPVFLGIDEAHSDIPLYHSWSLGIEEKFYLVWPVIAFLALKTLRTARLSACLFLAAISAVAPVISPRYGALLSPYYHILIGCGLAILLSDQKKFEALKTLGTVPGILLSCVALIIVHLVWSFSVTSPYHRIVDILYTIVAAVFLTSLLLAGKRLDNLFGMSGLAFVGGISYSIYLFHILCLNVVESLSSRPLVAVPVWLHATINVFLTVALASLVAWLLSITVEKPLVKIGHGLSDALLRSGSGNHTQAIGNVSTSRLSGGN